MDDVLTSDEEEALGMVRQALAEVRGDDGVASMGAITRAVVAAGALLTAEDGESGAFLLRGARFTLRSSAGRRGAVELAFQTPEKR